MEDFEYFYLARAGGDVPDNSDERTNKRLGKNVMRSMGLPVRAVNYNKFTRYVAGITVIVAGLSIFGDYKWRSYVASAHHNANELGVEIGDGFNDQITKQSAVNAAKSVVQLCNADNGTHHEKNQITNPFAVGICDMAEQLLQDEQAPPAKTGPSPVHTTTTTIHNNHRPQPILAQGPPRP